MPIPFNITASVLPAYKRVILFKPASYWPKGNLLPHKALFCRSFFFILGAAFNGILKREFKIGKLSQQQHSLLVETFGVLLVVMLSPYISSTLYITLLSFFLAIQLDAFPKVKGLPFTSVMSTGNLRNVGANLMTFLYTKDRQARHDAWLFALIVLAFLVGAFVSTCFVYLFDHYTLIGSSVILLTIFTLLFDFSKKVLTNIKPVRIIKLNNFRNKQVEQKSST